jgi:hypothetical protein
MDFEVDTEQRLKVAITGFKFCRLQQRHGFNLNTSTQRRKERKEKRKRK